jgi:hypothetical protein
VARDCFRLGTEALPWVAAGGNEERADEGRVLLSDGLGVTGLGVRGVDGGNGSFGGGGMGGCHVGWNELGAGGRRTLVIVIHLGWFEVILT